LGSGLPAQDDFKNEQTGTGVLSCDHADAGEHRRLHRGQTVSVRSCPFLTEKPWSRRTKQRSVTNVRVGRVEQDAMEDVSEIADAAEVINVVKPSAREEQN
jgi:hypothetical protein